MRSYEIIHCQGTDELPDFNLAANRGRREQGRVLRAALDWLTARRPSASAGRPGGERVRHG